MNIDYKLKYMKYKKKYLLLKGGSIDPTLEELNNFLNENYESDDQIIKEILHSKEFPDIKEAVDYYINQTNEEWTDNKYYLGGVMKLSIKDKITKEIIESLEKKFNSQIDYTNSFEMASVVRHQKRFRNFKYFLDNYNLMINHLKYKPGSDGAKEAENNFKKNIKKK